jgi:hypothetical protein
MKKIRKSVLTLLVLIALLALAAPMVAFAGSDGPNPSPSGATHGAFNKGNLVYGEPSSPGNGDSLNSSSFGLSGGSGGGQTGINNSAGAPWGDVNKAANDPNP